MQKPLVAAKKPVLVTMEGGKTYFWCACGRSKSQPYCDGSHRGSAFEPLKISCPASQQQLLCACKQTRNPPYCDGSHNSLDDGYEEASPEEIAATEHLPVTPRTCGESGKAELEGGCFVITPDPARLSRKGNLSVANLIGANDGASEISLFYLAVDSDPAVALSFLRGSAALFVLSGSGSIIISGRRHEIAVGQAAMICPGEEFFLLPDSESMTLTATVCPQDENPTWPKNPRSRFDENYSQRVFSVDESRRQAMADRFYQVLVDQDVCPSDMTQFLGEVPQSRAAFHRHLYEETITILSGEGYLWTQQARAAVQPGDVIFLPRQQSHSLECTSEGGMKLVGVFYPAGSPAINY